MPSLLPPYATKEVILTLCLHFLLRALLGATLHLLRRELWEASHQPKNSRQRGLVWYRFPFAPASNILPHRTLLQRLSRRQLAVVSRRQARHRMTRLRRLDLARLLSFVSHLLQAEYNDDELARMKKLLKKVKKAKKKAKKEKKRKDSKKVHFDVLLCSVLACFLVELCSFSP